MYFNIVISIGEHGFILYFYTFNINIVSVQYSIYEYIMT